MPLSPFVQRFTSSSRPERAVLVATVLGLLTLIDPAKLTPGKRFTYRAGLGALTAAAIVADPEMKLSPVNKLSVAAAVGGLTTGSAELTEKLDATVQRKLRSVGVDRPRVLMAGATVLFSLLSDLDTVRRSRAEARLTATKGGASNEAAEQLVPLPEHISALIGGMLGKYKRWGAAELRAQLPTAREPLEPGETSGSYGSYVLRVDESLPLAVPHTFEFPVTAHTTDAAGHKRTVTLSIHNGRLDSLNISDAESGDSAWPTDATWEYRTETSVSR